jgi:hypothetical protein
LAARPNYNEKLPKTHDIDVIASFLMQILMHNGGIVYGFARVSTETQDLSNPIALINRLAAERCMLVAPRFPISWSIIALQRARSP